MPEEEGRAEDSGDRGHVAGLPVALAVAVVRGRVMPVQRLEALFAPPQSISDISSLGAH